MIQDLMGWDPFIYSSIPFLSLFVKYSATLFHPVIPDGFVVDVVVIVESSLTAQILLARA